MPVAIGLFHKFTTQHWWSPLLVHNERDWIRVLTERCRSARFQYEPIRVHAERWHSSHIQYVLRICKQAIADRRCHGLWKKTVLAIFAVRKFNFLSFRHGARKLRRYCFALSQTVLTFLEDGLGGPLSAEIKICVLKIEKYAHCVLSYV